MVPLPAMPTTDELDSKNIIFEHFRERTSPPPSLVLILYAMQPADSSQPSVTPLSFSAYPLPPCISYALIQATVRIGTVLIWYLI